MIESPVLSARVTRAPRLERPSERQARRSRVRWLRLIVWAIVLLWCMLVWAGVYLGYVAAGGPLP
jgi:Flp pilus assembly protein TadB